MRLDRTQAKYGCHENADSEAPTVRLKSGCPALAAAVRMLSSPSCSGTRKAEGSSSRCSQGKEKEISCVKTKKLHLQQILLILCQAVCRNDSQRIYEAVTCTTDSSIHSVCHKHNLPSKPGHLENLRSLRHPRMARSPACQESDTVKRLDSTDLEIVKPSTTHGYPHDNTRQH